MLVGAVLFAVAGATTVADTPGRFIVGIAAAGLLLPAALGGLRRPRLALTTLGDRPALAVRTLSAVHAYTAADIARIRVTDNRRLGRRNPMLELDVRRRSEAVAHEASHDGDERLLLFTRWDLGTNPHDVHAAIVAHLGPTAPASGGRA
jgi:hypothetical protein